MKSKSANTLLQSRKQHRTYTAKRFHFKINHSLSTTWKPWNVGHRRRRGFRDRLITASTSKQAEDTTNEIEHHNREKDTKGGFRWCDVRTGNTPRVEQTPDNGEQANEDRKSVICHRNTPLQERNSVEDCADKLDNEKQHQDGERSNDDHTNPNREEATKRSNTVDKRHYSHLQNFRIVRMIPR
nr:MAG TPA: hypothetical protein [Inoviridae sp.]